ncbi:MAG: DNA methyltransferase [Thermoplasmata archaeon]
MGTAGQKFILEFSKENLEAAFFELNSIQVSFKDFRVLTIERNIAIIIGNEKSARRSAFLKFISAVICEADSPWKFSTCEIPEGMFYVRIIGGNDQKNINEAQIGDIIGAKGRVNFHNPDFILRAIKVDNWYLAKLVYSQDVKEMEKRRSPLRPFFSPVSMHPRYAKFLVNSTVCIPGDTILDPFCGTGGILIEAGLLGLKAIGNDVSLSMVMGARLNCKFYGLNDVRITNHDVSNLSLDENVDGIATDFPYGRNSAVFKTEGMDLYRNAFMKFHEFLKEGKRCSVVVSDLKSLEPAQGLFSTVKIIPVRQHKSLTRFYSVLVKK